MSFAELASALQEQNKSEMLLEKIRKFLPNYPSVILKNLEQTETASTDPDKYREWRRDFGHMLNQLKDDGDLVEHGSKMYLPEQLEIMKTKKKTAKTVNTVVIPREVMGVVHAGGDVAKFEPLDGNLPIFPVSKNIEAMDGQIITARLSENLNFVEAIESIHGSMTDENALGKLSALSVGIPLTFPKDVLSDTQFLEIPSVSDDRTDFTKIPFITIDPETAKDFDDAIYVRKTKQGWEAMVAIADVSHYVKPGTNLAKEAWKRGNSTYLPDMVIPMLPEELSNGVCSLKPNELRAAVVCTMNIDKDGHITSRKFERGLIKSRARLNYDEVQDAIDHKKQGLPAGLSRGIWPIIEKSLEFYNARLKDKTRRGTLDIALAEQRISIKRSRDISLALEVGNEAHGIIEEFAVAANACVGEETDIKNVQSIYRVHGTPKEEVYNEFRDDLTALGVSVPKTGDIRQRMLRILSQAKHSKDPDEVYTIVARMQSLASYSTEPDNHFGLGLRRYSHWTSPIRRASDLVVHMLQNEMYDMRGGHRLTASLEAKMSEMAEHFSKTERRSERAERECNRRIMAMFIRRNINTEFNACVTQVNGKKLWVMVKENNIEVKTEIRASDIPDPLYNYKPGDKVTIKPMEVSPVSGVLKFKIV